MSSWGKRSTKLLQVDAEVVTGMEDGIAGDPRLVLHVEVGPWELDLTLERGRRGSWYRHAGMFGTPLVRVDYGVERFQATRYSGDWVEGREYPSRPRRGTAR